MGESLGESTAVLFEGNFPHLSFDDVMIVRIPC